MFHLFCYKMEITKKLVEELIILLFSVHLFLVTGGYFASCQKPHLWCSASCCSCKRHLPPLARLQPILYWVSSCPKQDLCKTSLAEKGRFPSFSGSPTYHLGSHYPFCRTISPECSYPFSPDLVQFNLTKPCFVAPSRLFLWLWP